MLIPLREEIRKRRIEKELTMSALSKKANLPNNALYRIEKGNFKYVFPIRAIAIANALDCDISDIFIEVKNHDNNIRKN